MTRAGPASPDDLLGELLVAFLCAKPPSEAARNWFLDGALRAIREDKPLDYFLGLSCAGKPRLKRRMMMIKRDAYLVAALQDVALDSQIKAWERCQRLAPIVKTFQRITWGQAQRLSDPPLDWPTHKRHLWHAMRTGIPLPESPHALRAILVQAGGYSHNNKGATLLAQFL